MSKRIQWFAYVGGKDFLDIGGVAFGRVADKYLIRIDGRSPGLEVVLRDRLAKELIALVGPVAAKGPAVGQFINRLVKGRDAGRRQGFGDVADTQLDQGFFRMAPLECFDPPGDIGKKIGGLELLIVVVDRYHGCLGG